MPLRLTEDEKSKQAAMQAALIQGLKQNYTVFSGEQVEQKAHEVFLKESRNTAHTECDETKCLQDIAGAFQSELIAVANVSKQPDGYFLSLTIQNIFDNKVIFSNSLPCKSCDAYQVVDKLKELTGMTNQSAKPDDENSNPQPSGRYALYAGFATGKNTLGFSGINNNATATASYSGVNLGFRIALGEKSALDVSGNSSSGTQNLYAPAANQPFKKTGIDVTFSSIFAGEQGDGWKYFVGYNTDTMQLNAIGQTWSMDTIKESGMSGGVDWRTPFLTGTFGASIEVDMKSAYWYDDVSFNAQSKLATGGGIAIYYIKIFSNNFGGSLSLSEQKINYDFNAYSVSNANAAIDLNLFYYF